MSKLKQYWERIKVYMIRFLSWEKSVHPEAVISPDKAIYVPIGDPFESIRTTPAFKISEIKNITEALVNTLKNQAEYFWKFGHRNGVLGNNKVEEAVSIANTYAGALQLQLDAEVTGVKEALLKEQKFNEDQKKRAIENYEAEKEYLEYLNIQKRYNSNTFSPTLAWVYLLIGIGLFISDIPLALELIRSGFNLLTSKEYPLSNLFFDPLNVFLYNWEAFFTAFGVAFVTIYVKMYYDDYVLFSEGVNSIRKNKLEFLNVDEKSVKAEFRIKFWVRTFILLFVIGMLFFMSWFRSVSAARIDPNFNDSFISKTVFFFITILLPIVSGICISVSLKILQNISNRKRATSTVDGLKGKVESVAKELNESEKNLKVVESLLTVWIAQGRLLDLVKDYLHAYYKYGYQQGILEPDNFDKVTDYITRIEIMRNKTLAHNTFERLREIQ